MTEMLDSMQTQLKTFSSAKTDPTSTNRKYYCWSCGKNYTHGSKTCLAKETCHKEYVQYKKRLGGSKKG